MTIVSTVIAFHQIKDAVKYCIYDGKSVGVYDKAFVLVERAVYMYDNLNEQVTDIWDLIFNDCENLSDKEKLKAIEKILMRDQEDEEIDQESLHDEEVFDMYRDAQLEKENKDDSKS